VDTSLDLIVPPDPNTAYDIKEVITRVVDEVRGWRDVLLVSLVLCSFACSASSGDSAVRICWYTAWLVVAATLETAFSSFAKQSLTVQFRCLCLITGQLLRADA
jgi:hypothetical protein